jgi:hypothetical protein
MGQATIAEQVASVEGRLDQLTRMYGKSGKRMGNPFVAIGAIGTLLGVLGALVLWGISLENSITANSTYLETLGKEQPLKRITENSVHIQNLTAQQSLDRASDKEARADIKARLERISTQLDELLRERTRYKGGPH